MGMGAIVLWNGDAIFSDSRQVAAAKTNSSNVAEYLAFITVLKFLMEMDFNAYPTQRIDIRGDSKLVVCQMNEQWRIKNGYYLEYAKEAQQRWKDLRIRLAQNDIIVTLQWIPRAQNDVADVLSKKGMIEAGVEFKIQPNG